MQVENVNIQNTISQQDIKNFFGIDKAPNHNLVKECNICFKYVHRDYYYTNLNYCVHCWGWLNSQNLCLESGKYELDNLNEDDIKIMLSKTFKLHTSIKCTNKDCVYNKIIDAYNNNKLNKNLAIAVGLQEDILLFVPKIVKNNERNIDINYKTSNIFI